MKTKTADREAALDRAWRRERNATLLRRIAEDRETLARQYDTLARYEADLDAAQATLDAARDEYHDLRTNPDRQKDRGELSWKAERAMHQASFALQDAEKRVAYMQRCLNVVLNRIADNEAML